MGGPWRRSVVQHDRVEIDICEVGLPSKQSRKKSALILASQFGALFDYGTLLLSFFYFETGANELVKLKWDEVTQPALCSSNTI